MAQYQRVGRPDLERAFLDGYGHDPQSSPGWTVTLLRKAVSTAAWAHQVGDEAFEAHGHYLIGQYLARPARPQPWIVPHV